MHPFPHIFVFRWLQATKSIISGTNTQALTAKADLLKEEVDEAMNKVELCKVTSTNTNKTQTSLELFLLHSGLVYLLQDATSFIFNFA